MVSWSLEKNYTWRTIHHEVCSTCKTTKLCASKGNLNLASPQRTHLLRSTQPRKSKTLFVKCLLSTAQKDGRIAPASPQKKTLLEVQWPNHRRRKPCHERDTNKITNNAAHRHCDNSIKIIWLAGSVKLDLYAGLLAKC